MNKGRKQHAGGLPYANDAVTGELRSIFTVANGKLCNCVCPGCGWPMVAVQGETRKKHFRHKADEEGFERECSNPSGAVESIIHKFVKRYISRINRLYPPAFYFEFSNYKGYKVDPFRVFESKGWDIHDRVEEDRSLSDKYIPDVSCKFGRGRLAIEVFCTNAVSVKKLEDMRASDVHVLEVNCSDVELDDLGDDWVRKRIYDPRYTKWLHVVLTESEERKRSEWLANRETFIDSELKSAEILRQKIAASEQKEREVEESVRFESMRKQALMSLGRYVENKVKWLLEEQKASAFSDQERNTTITLINELSDIIDSRLPVARNSFDHTINTSKFLVGHVESRTKYFLSGIAEVMTSDFLARYGDEVVKELYDKGWDGVNLLDEKIDHLEWGFWQYVEFELNDQLKTFIRNTSKKYGFFLRSPIG